MQRDVGVQVAEDVSELLLRHDGQFQHGVVVRLGSKSPNGQKTAKNSARKAICGGGKGGEGGLAGACRNPAKL